MLSRVEEKLSLSLFLLLCVLASDFAIHAVLLVCLLLFRTVIPSLRPLSVRADRRFWKFFWYFFLLSLAMILVNGVLIREGPVAFRLLIDFYFEGLLFGLETGARLLAAIVILLVLFNSTPIREFAGFLERIGLPNQIVMTFLLTLHFVDQLPLRIERIFTAQEARGAPVRSSLPGRIRAFAALLTPLVLSSVVESIDRGMALELRGFPGKRGRESAAKQMPPARTTASTIIFLFLSVLVLAWIILRRLIP